LSRLPLLSPYTTLFRSADASCLAFLLAYVDYDLRASLGWFALPLLIYVMGWEGWGALRAVETDPGSDAAADGVGAELLGWLGGRSEEHTSELQSPDHLV